MTTHAATTIGLVVAFAASAAAQAPRPAATRSVTLTLSEYNRLLDLANRPPAAAPAPPVAAVLASADLRVRVDRDMARGTFVLSGTVLRPGINRVNLINLPGGSGLVDATLSGKPLPLTVEGAAHGALLPGPGPFAVSLEWGAPLVFAPGRASFTLPVPPAGTARVTFDVPGDQADVRLSAGLITRRAVDGGRTIVEATLDPGSSTEVWWHMRDSAPIAAAREVRTVADVMTLVTLGDSDARMVALVDLTVLQGEPQSIELQLPAGYELTSVSGISLESREPRDGRVALVIADPASRRHQFLVTLERPHTGGSFQLETGFVSLPTVQRERGEVAIEGTGTLELTAAEREGVQRIDVRELHLALQSLARQPMLAAFRYYRAGAARPGLALTVSRFDDAGVLAAVAEHATATTLITSEGRALTELNLRIRNRAQPFLRVQLPAGATIVSVEVAGESAKPVLGADGTRVPLLRANFRPQGSYSVSFVYMHAGTPFAKKGTVEMTLPKLDIPITLVEWEVFVPDRYQVRSTGGNVIDAARVSLHMPSESQAEAGSAVVPAPQATAPARISSLDRNVGVGRVQGRVVDSSGGTLPGVTVRLDASAWSRAIVTDGNGFFDVPGVPSGTIIATASLAGFRPQVASFVFDQQPLSVQFTLGIESRLTESVTMSSAAGRISREMTDSIPGGRPVQPLPQNFIDIQRRAEGVLPIRVDVPRAGTSHRFVKPLVVDQAAAVTLSYKRR
jgi:hypothetical protein